MLFGLLGDCTVKELKRPLNEVDIGFAENIDKSNEMARIKSVESAAFRYTFFILTAYFIIFFITQVLLNISQYSWGMLFYWLKTEVIGEENPVEKERFFRLAKELSWAIIGIIDMAVIYLSIVVMKLNTKVFSVVFCAAYAFFAVWGLINKLRPVAVLIGIGGFILSLSLIYAYKNERVLRKLDGYPYFRSNELTYVSRVKLIDELHKKEGSTPAFSPEDVFK